MFDTIWTFPRCHDLVTTLTLLEEPVREGKHARFPVLDSHMALYTYKCPASFVALMLGRLRMTTEEALRTYNSLSCVIFSKNNKKRIGQDGTFKATALVQKVQDIVLERDLGSSC